MVQRYLIALLVVLSTYSYSQENKNKIMVNGAFFHLNTKSKIPIAYPSTQYSKSVYRGNYAHAQIGYFISNNFAFGLSGSLLRLKNQVKSSYPTENFYLYKQESDYISVFTRYNYTIDKRKLGCFLKLYGGYLWENRFSHQTYTDPQNNIVEITDFSRAKGMEFNLYAGIIYFINRWASVETTLGNVAYYISDAENKNSNQKNLTLVANFSMASLNLGFSFYLGRKTQDKKDINNEGN